MPCLREAGTHWTDSLAQMPPFLTKLRPQISFPPLQSALLAAGQLHTGASAAPGQKDELRSALSRHAPSHPVNAATNVVLVGRIMLALFAFQVLAALLFVVTPLGNLPPAWTLPATAFLALDALGCVLAATYLRHLRSQDSQDIARWQVTLDAMTETVFEVNAEGTILFFHDSVRHPLIYPLTVGLIGTPLQDLLAPGYADTLVSLIRKSEKLGRAKSGQVKVMVAGAARWYEFSLTRIVVDGDNPTRHIVLARDITQSKDDEEAILHLANHDQLTGLVNRRLLIERLRTAMHDAKSSGQEGAVFFLDMDNFKSLNDTLGHDFGDVLLQQVASRLKTDISEARTVARFGGDEFVVLVETLGASIADSEAAAYAISDRILFSLSRPYDLGGRIVRTSPSIGVILFSTCPNSPEDLLTKADIAMYQAKKAGRNTARLFDPDMQNALHWRATIENEMHLALPRRQLELFYQIQVDAHGNHVGAEALLRWHHDELKWVSPGDFISVAEEIGLIIPIGQWVLDTACAQLRSWAQNQQTAHLHLCVNISAKQFRQDDFVEQVMAAIEGYGINPSLLYLELTESMLLENIDDTITRMKALKALGVRFSLDDFGTGYSSLQYLRRLPLDQLKIDQSFVKEIKDRNHDVVIVDTIIAMARHLKLDVIAEGVETPMQRDLLLALGCLHFQGHLFGKPVPVDGLLNPQG